MSDNRLGITKIVQSAKGTMALFVLATSTVIAALGKMTIPYATCMGVVFSIFAIAHTVTNINANTLSAKLRSIIKPQDQNDKRQA